MSLREVPWVEITPGAAAFDPHCLDLLPVLRRGRALSSYTGAAFSRRPNARLAWGATPADCASVVPCEESKPSARSRDLPGVQPHNIQRRGRALSSYTGAAFSRRPNARLAWGATPRLPGKYKTSDNPFPARSTARGGRDPGHGLPPGAIPPGRRWRRFGASAGTRRRS